MVAVGHLKVLNKLIGIILLVDVLQVFQLNVILLASG